MFRSTLQCSLVAAVLASLATARAATVTIVTDDAAAESVYSMFLKTRFGHDVSVRTDLATLDATKLSDLESQDLIIVSTRTDSGQYDDGSEVAQWNGMTTPLLLHNVNMVRSTRWKWINTSSLQQSTITDLVVDVPGSAVFDHTTVTGGNVNLFGGGGQGVWRVVGQPSAGNGTRLANYFDGANPRPFIAEWSTGTEYYSGAGQTAGGERIFFGSLVYGDSLSGLSHDGLQMVANAVQTLLGQPTVDLDTIPLPILAQYEFPTATSAETGPGYSPTTLGAGMDGTVDMAIKDTAGNISMTIRGTSASETPPTLRIDPDGGAASLAEAVQNDKFFEFTIRPQGDLRLDLFSLEFDVGRGGSGTPRGWGLFSSVDNFATEIATRTVGTIEPDLTHVFVDLSDSRFQGLGGPLTFRMYSFTPGDGLSLEFDNITLLGAVVPEPSTAALLAAGLLGTLIGFRRRKRR